jgi:hypothetical protein
MKITLSDSQIPVVLASLEAFQRFHINQPKTALEAIFPEKCMDLGWKKMQELVAPLQKAFFPDYPLNGGPGICNPEISKQPQIAYEIQKQMQQYLALQKSGGYFGNTVDFSGASLNPSGEPPPKIEGLEEMRYKDFWIDMENIEEIYDSNEYEKIWAYAKSNMNLPSCEKMEIFEKSGGFSGHRGGFYIRVHKPRKPFDNGGF